MGGAETEGRLPVLRRYRHAPSSVARWGESVEMQGVAYRTVLGTEDTPHSHVVRKLTLCEMIVLAFLIFGCYIIFLFGMWAILELAG